MSTVPLVRPRVAAALLLAGCAAAPSPEPETAVPPSLLPALAAIDAAAAEIDPGTIRAHVDRLVSFGTRHTLSATEGDRGIGAARRWIHEEFERIAAASGRTGEEAMRVRFDVHAQGPATRIPRDAEIVNVEAVLPGSSPEARERHVYLVAHYDSRASEPLDAESEAPGANDDGSGVAALLEAARVLSTRRFDATLVFLAVAGEEQGLYGSRLHAAAVRTSGRRITAVLSNDIVGDPTGPGGSSARNAIRVFSEGVPRAATLDEVRRIASLGGENDSSSRSLARYVEEVAERHGTRVRPRLVFRTDRFLRGGDHSAFLERGIAAVRFTDVHETYDRQHQDVRVVDGRPYGDLPEFVDESYLADVARLDATVLAHLANAPAPPADARIVVAQLGTDATLRWTRSPEPDVARYEVVRRATTSLRWEHVHPVGDATEATLPFTKDDWLFGVRAVDRDGFRSLVAFPGAEKE